MDREEWELAIGEAAGLPAQYRDRGAGQVRGEDEGS